MSVTDWLNKGRPIMSNELPSPRTDAEFLADVAISALQGGRYELARELTRLAAQAKHMELTDQPRMVPMIGQTRDERPGLGPTGDNADLAESARIDVPANGRCAYRPGHNGAAECGAVSYLGDGDWYHLDPALDMSHNAVVTHWVEGTH